MRPVEIEHFEPERRYQPAHFEMLPAPPEPPQTRTGERRSRCRRRGVPAHAARLGTGGGGWDPADFRRVFAGCSWLRWCHHQRRTLPEGAWYAALSIVGRCELSPNGDGGADGRELAHRMSRGYPRYEPAKTDAKLDHALDDTGPSTCRHIATELGARKKHCDQCPYFGLISSPIVLGNPPHFEDPVVPLQHGSAAGGNPPSVPPFPATNHRRER